MRMWSQQGCQVVAACCSEQSLLHRMYSEWPVIMQVLLCPLLQQQPG